MNLVNLALSLNGPAQYLTLGPLSISYANAAVILVIVALFVAAIVIPFPSHDDSE
jgi:hypothetical protein